MSLITNNISGSSSGNWQIGLTGSVIISDRPTVATFPVLPGDVSLFIDGTKRTVVKGDSTLSGSLVVSGSTILAGAVSLAGNSQTVTHTGTGALTISSNNGSVVVEGSTFAGNDVTVAGDIAVNGGDLTTSAATFNLLNTNATTLNVGGVATTLKMGAPGVTLNVGNVLTGTTSLVTVKGDLQVDGNNIKSNGGTYTPITLSSTSRNTHLNGILFVGDAASGGGDIVLRPQTSPTVLSCDIQTTSTTANVFASDPTGGLGTTTVNIGRAGSTNKVTVGGLLKVGANKILSSGDYESIVLESTSPTVTVNGALHVGDSTTSGAGDLYLKPPSGQAADIITTSTNANLFNTTATSIGIGGAATSIDMGKDTAFSLSGISAYVSGNLYVGSGPSNIAAKGDITMRPGSGYAADLMTTSNTAILFGTANPDTSTVPTTIELGSHASTTGVTKTVNIGTAGGAGSTTVVNIGSNLDGVSEVNIGDFSSTASRITLGSPLTDIKGDTWISGSTILGNNTSVDSVLVNGSLSTRVNLSVTGSADLGNATSDAVNIFGILNVKNALKVSGLNNHDAATTISVNDTDFMLWFNAAGTQGINLPSATSSNLGRVLIIRNNGSSGTKTISAAAGDAIHPSNSTSNVTSISPAASTRESWLFIAAATNVWFAYKFSTT